MRCRIVLPDTFGPSRGLFEVESYHLLARGSEPFAKPAPIAGAV
jgi:hypothetical protein